MALVPALLIVAALAAAAVLGAHQSTGEDPRQVRVEVASLLAGLPQNGNALGSPKAPITLRMFADLECPTVKRFTQELLPSIIETWVRNGTLRIEYRSMETDTSDESTFFAQETAALAAGRQDKMWTFILTFINRQREVSADYVSTTFLRRIASEVPDLSRRQWRRALDDALLSKQVALGVYAGHARGLRSTPSFVIGPTNKDRKSHDVLIAKQQIEFSLKKDLADLGKEDLGDLPTVRSSLGALQKPRTDRIKGEL